MNMKETMKRVLPVAAVTGVIAFVAGLFVASVMGLADRESDSSSKGGYLTWRALALRAM